jgi:hypothetical protein
MIIFLSDIDALLEEFYNNFKNKRNDAERLSEKSGINPGVHRNCFRSIQEEFSALKHNITNNENIAINQYKSSLKGLGKLSYQESFLRKNLQAIGNFNYL